MRSNADMKTIEEIRRANIRALIARAGGNAAFSIRIGKLPAQVSQWANASADSLTGRPRSIGSDTCRHIEAVFDLECGWLDHDHSETGDLDPSAVAIAHAFMDLEPGEQQKIKSYMAVAAATKRVGMEGERAGLSELKKEKA